MQSRMRFSAFVCLRRIPSSSMPICCSRRLSSLAASALPPPQPARPASVQASPTATSPRRPRLLLPPTFGSLSIATVGSDDHEVTGAELPFQGVDRHQPLARQAGLHPHLAGRPVGRLHPHPVRPV